MIVQVWTPSYMGSTKTEQALFSCDVNTEVLVIQISNAYSVFASQACPGTTRVRIACVHAHAII